MKSTSHFPFRLGDEVKDRVSSYRGIVIAQTEWLNGCQRITIQPQGLDKDNRPYSAETIDAQQLELVRDSVVQIKPLIEQDPSAKEQRERAPVRTGGPTPAPTRNADPRRI